MKLPQFSFLKKNKSPEILETSPIGIIDIIAPASIEVKPDYLRIGDRLARTYFIFSYPRYLNVGWISPILNLDIPIDVSFYIDPVDTGMILKKLRNQIADIEAELMEREQKGLVRDPN